MDVSLHCPVLSPGPSPATPFFCNFLQNRALSPRLSIDMSGHGHELSPRHAHLSLTLKQEAGVDAGANESEPSDRTRDYFSTAAPAPRAAPVEQNLLGNHFGCDSKDKQQPNTTKPFNLPESEISDSKDKIVNSQVGSLQQELSRINEENEKLRYMLVNLSSEYKMLQGQLVTLIQQQQQSSTAQDHAAKSPINHSVLTSTAQRGASSTEKLGEEAPMESSSDTDTSAGTEHDRKRNVLSLDMDGESSPKKARSSSPDNQADAGSANPDISSVIKKPESNSANNNNKDTTSTESEAIVRKARVSVRARSDAPMLNDGCQWRKYGQKMAKGNPCPRAYYRCTMATGCPVRKQVQRCAEDTSILITTYEGTHNHALPPAATAMASTTSAAASMLLAGSSMSASTSDPGQQLMVGPGGQYFAFPPSAAAMAATSACISASAPFPTITLDLTNPNNNFMNNNNNNPNYNNNNPLMNNNNNFGSQFGMSAPAWPPKFPFSVDVAAPPAFQLPRGASPFGPSRFSVNQSSNPNPNPAPNPDLLESVSAATAAITADPNFTAALAAAITSILSQNKGNPNPISNPNPNPNPNPISQALQQLQYHVEPSTNHHMQMSQNNNPNPSSKALQLRSLPLTMSCGHSNISSVSTGIVTDSKPSTSNSSHSHSHGQLTLNGQTLRDQ